MSGMEETSCMVSVVIPVYNSERFLGEAIESVLSQSYRRLELILVDDGSTDGSAEVAKGFEDPRIRYYHQANSGIGAARNAGVSLAQGEYLAFLDDDDFWLPGKLELQMAALGREPELDMVFAHIKEFFQPAGPEEDPAAMRRVEGRVLAGYHAGSMLIKRESFARVGPFATNWRMGEFIEWYSRAEQKGLKSLLLPDVLMGRRIHDCNVGIRERSRQSDYLHILKQALDRKRAK